jgi:hypothetical protein
MAKPKLKIIEETKPLKLDLGCGKNPRAGFIGVDCRDFGQEITTDLRQKWPWKNGSVEEVHASHFLEHLTGHERVHFFNELYRVLIDGGKATIVVPHWSSERAYGDPTHQWPPVVFFAFYYLNKEWRAQNAPHSGYECNFEATGGNQIGPPWTLRSQEAQAFAQAHYTNVSTDLVCTVIKR